MNGAPSQKAYVVFTGKTDLWWLKWLKPGFRHCFVILNDGRQWLSLDPLSNHIDLQVYHHVSSRFDLPGFLRKEGHTVVRAPLIRGHLKPAPFMIFTCVEAVKRVLGLHRSSILTPWQLYNYLRHCEEPQVTKQSSAVLDGPGLLRCARNDGLKTNDYQLKTKKGDLSWEV